MPSHSAANPAIQQMYINGHFCYAFKFGIITNGLGIVRDISFYNKNFLDSHPGIILGKKSDFPDEDKSPADSNALIPVRKDFFRKHPLINPKIFLEDAAFDTVEIYKYLLQEAFFEKVCSFALLDSMISFKFMISISFLKSCSVPPAYCQLHLPGKYRNLWVNIYQEALISIFC